MPDSVEQGLLLDIIEHPEDDAVRLIYADWLEEHGKVSAAMWIRFGLLEPARRFTETYTKPQGSAEVVWQRGFIVSVNCSLEWWLKKGYVTASLNPVEYVNLSNVLVSRHWTVVGNNRGHTMRITTSNLPAIFRQSLYRWLFGQGLAVEESLSQITVRDDTGTHWLSEFCIWWARNHSLNSAR
jgi:uncharacterized protein (TIGR02996 family)